MRIDRNIIEADVTFYIVWRAISQIVILGEGYLIFRTCACRILVHSIKSRKYAQFNSSSFFN